MILQQNYIQTVVFLPVMNVLEKMQRLYLICFPDIRSRRNGIVWSLHQSGWKTVSCSWSIGKQNMQNRVNQRRSRRRWILCVILQSLRHSIMHLPVEYRSICLFGVSAAWEPVYQVSVKISTCVRSLENFWNTAVFSISKIMELMKSIWEALTGCHEILTAVWKLYFR